MKKTHPDINSKKTNVKKTNYYCELCDYKSSNKTDFHRHLKTKKHKKRFSAGNNFSEISHTIKKNA